MDTEQGFTRRFVDTPAIILILDDYVWADSAYSGVWLRDLLSLGRFEYRVYEKVSTSSSSRTWFWLFCYINGRQIYKKNWAWNDIRPGKTQKFYIYLSNILLLKI